ncbi:MAG: hypothetical protein ACREVN_04645 [Gammaproteobacteria bacterium]
MSAKKRCLRLRLVIVGYGRCGNEAGAEKKKKQSPGCQQPHQIDLPFKSMSSIGTLASLRMAAILHILGKTTKAGTHHG